MGSFYWREIKMLQTVKDNLSFVVVCILIVAILYGLSVLYERFCMKERKKLSNTHYVTYVAIFAALAGVLMLFEIPLFFAPEFYKIDLSEIPVLICTFYLGPVAGVLTEMIKVLIKLLLKGTTTAFVGDFANFAVGCSFVLPASMIYHAKKNRKMALLGMLVGTLVMTIFGSLFNAVYLLPKFAAMFGIPLEATGGEGISIVGMGSAVNSHITSVSTLVLFAVVPFNLIKGVVDSILTGLLYKRISPILHKGDAKKIEHKEKKV